jgi:hypothetical protein
MRVKQLDLVRSVRRCQRAQPRKATARPVGLIILASSLVGCVLPTPASAAGGFALSKAAPPRTVCPELVPGNPECEALRVPTVAASSADAVGPELQGTGEKGGFDPKDLREAYNLAAETGGSGQTVAVIDEYDDPKAESDLKVYREKYKLPECTEATKCFAKVNQKGETKNYPAGEKVWAGETSLDLDMVSAACSGCHILLVEANAASTEAEFISNMLAAEATAYSHETYGDKTTELSNSWDSWEGELTEKEQLTDDEKYLEHPGVPVTFASGDFGYTAGKIRWPASSQYVIAVGGTKLTKVTKTKENERGWTEEVWRNTEKDVGEHGAGTTSGCSAAEPKPSWQKDKEGCSKRTVGDTAADASVQSPVSVYDSYEEPGWENYGGTSAAAPFIAGIEALSTSRSRTLGAQAFYVAGENKALYDVTVGGNGECGDLAGEAFTTCHAKVGYESPKECGAPESVKYYLCHAESGYDAPTGRGAPDGPLALTGSPTGSTGSATGITETEATLNGMIDPEGSEAKYYFEYGTTKSYGSKTVEASAGSGTSNVEVSKAITGLAAETTYDFRIVAKNSSGTFDGANVEFKTLKAPSVETKAATSVTTTGATLNGTVNPNGAETKYYFEYGATESYGSKTAEVSAGSGTSSIEESKAITGLEPETTYHFRIVATNKAGTTDGAGKEFTTLKKPSVETKAATSVTAFGAALNGAVNPNGSETTYYFEYGTTESYGTKTAEASAGSGTSSVEESTIASGLQSETTYDFRIVATNSGGTVYGGNQKFTTLESAPVVVTDAATSVTDAGGTLKGTVNPEGKEAKYDFEYGKTVSYGTKTAEASAGSGRTAVEESSVVTGLEPEVTYHYRIVAKNAFGMSDGADHTFTTLAQTWLLQTTPNDTGGVESFLTRVSCSSSTACTSVGEYLTLEDGGYAFAERWNGTAWTVQSIPNPTGAEESYLQGVSCTSSTACTATGGYYNSEGKLVSLAESWNGTEWKVQTVPSPSGAKSSVLHVVSCKSSAECTAVGRYENSEGVYLALAERWNGTEWKVQTVPNPTGTKESLFKGVSCASSTACTADGWYVNSSGSTATLAESWNGTEWKVQTTPNEAGATASKLSGVACTSSTACEAGGWYVSSEGHELALAESWNGTEWKVQTVPKPTEAVDSILDGVSCFSSSDCAASGTYETSSTSDATLAEHWNGTEWKVQPTPNVTEELEGLKATQPSALEGISCPTATVCITTGIYQNDSGEPSWETMAQKSS